MDGVFALIGFSLFFAIAFGFAAYMRYLKHKETIKMIEKGLVELPKPRNGRDNLRWGIVLTAIGIALCIGLYPFGFLGDGLGFPLNFGPWMLIGLLPTFFGLGLILIHYLTKENGEDEEVEAVEEPEAMEDDFEELLEEMVEDIEEETEGE